mmetsp:Transcript_15927/g.20221  ORF Transcript_15927/g.20221 Transcript_15927/m.20221 type:complete len:202 (-) Transcript_15927:12-617(-)
MKVRKDDNTSSEKCNEMSKFYHGKFDDIPTLTSIAYLHQKQHQNYILVDVRSQAEQKLSMIPHAITMGDFERRMKKLQHGDDWDDGNHDNNIDDSTTIVTYCTIGYRSGLEGRRLRDEYNLYGRIMNLDGIVCYTHACKEMQSKGNGESFSLVDPTTNQETNQVHVFGEAWNYTHNSFTPTYFSKPVMAFRGLSVGCKSFF